MTRFNAFFQRKEFACSCGCGFDTVDAELLEVLTDLREHFQTMVTVTSGARCKAHNEAVGGGKTSQHLYGRAADIKLLGVAPKEVQAYLLNKYSDQYGIGSYNSFTHIDTRQHPARW